MSETIVFSHPEPKPSSTRIWPVFLPFAGCPFRCAFCAQDKQTGRDHADLTAVREELETDLEGALEKGRGPYELAFYGGTFTALPGDWPETFLELAARFRERGLITRVRCSTRPDCVDVPMLERLSALGLDLVELGIQSFDDRPLLASGRGYDGDTARRGCHMVREAGLGLGIQLLPGLPGDEPAIFQEDVTITAGIKPETARLYPCLVIRGTPLARMWERCEYSPWSITRTRDELARALPVLWAADVHVIRLGLAPEDTLAENILAGPWHPALGQSVRSLVLLELIREKLRELGGRPARLTVPRRYQGELLGHKNELAPVYAELGLDRHRIAYGDCQDFVIRSL